MIKQILKHEAYNKPKKQSFIDLNPTKEMYFELVGKKPEILKSYNNSLCEYLEELQKEKLPVGIVGFDTIFENKSFRIHYLHKEITEEKVLEYIRSLKL